MAIQVNIFNSGSVPTATELANFINELNTDLDSIVTLNTEQVIEGAKTFWGSKMLKFKQKVTADKLGFTFYDYQGKEVGNFEYDNKNNFRLLALGNYYSSANQEIEGHVGFKVYNKSALAAYRLLCPLAGNAKNSIPSLTDTYTNFYMPLVFTNGAASVMADNNGKVDLSSLIGSGSGDGTLNVIRASTTDGINCTIDNPDDLAAIAEKAANGESVMVIITINGRQSDCFPVYYSNTNKETLNYSQTAIQGNTIYNVLFMIDIESKSLNVIRTSKDLFSGSYNDLADKPYLFSGNYNDLTNKPSLFSGSYNDLTDKPVLFSGDYTDLTNKPIIPVNLSDLSDDSTHRLVTDTEKTSWNNKSDFSGSYNDLTNKPIIPTVPAISTNITNDATSDTKTASPKAVKDFVEGKGYLTQHQDISGKADQTDLEALEDRVETLEQGGGSTVQYSYLKLIPDLDAYTDAPIGEIVKFVGQTGKYKRGWDYEKVSSGGDIQITIVCDASPTGISLVTTNSFEYSELVDGYFGHVYGENHQALLTFSTTLSVGDKVVYWDSNDANPTSTTITSVNSEGFSVGNNFISFNDVATIKISKFTNVDNYVCFIKGSPDDLAEFELPPMHERFYFNGNTFKIGGCNRSELGLECENFNVDVKQGSVYIENIDNENTSGRYFWTGKNTYTMVSHDCDSMGIYPVAWGFIPKHGNSRKNGDTVYKGSRSGNTFNVTGTDTLRVSGSTAYIGGYEISASGIYDTDLYYEFTNSTGDIVYIHQSILTGAPKNATYAVFSKTRGWINASIETKVADSDLSFVIGTPSISWQPILMPTASN